MLLCCFYILFEVVLVSIYTTKSSVALHLNSFSLSAAATQLSPLFVQRIEVFGLVSTQSNSAYPSPLPRRLNCCCCSPLRFTIPYLGLGQLNVKTRKTIVYKLWSSLYRSAHERKLEQQLAAAIIVVIGKHFLAFRLLSSFCESELTTSFFFLRVHYCDIKKKIITPTFFPLLLEALCVCVWVYSFPQRQAASRRTGCATPRPWSNNSSNLLSPLTFKLASPSFGSFVKFLTKRNGNSPTATENRPLVIDGVVTVPSLLIRAMV